MEQLIKITSEPMRMVRFSQNARLINADSVDIERRKAMARQISFRNTAGQSGISVEDIKRINHTFSKKHVSTAVPSGSVPQVVSRQPQYPQTSATVSAPDASVAQNVSSDVASAAVPVSTSGTVSEAVQDISVETYSSYTAQRGAFEMRVAKGELTYLPPMVMTIITQRPQIHIEYLGDFNYVPPRDDSGSNVNLFT